MLRYHSQTYKLPSVESISLRSCFQLTSPGTKVCRTEVFQRDNGQTAFWGRTQVTVRAPCFAHSTEPQGASAGMGDRFPRLRIHQSICPNPKNQSVFNGQKGCHPISQNPFNVYGRVYTCGCPSNRSVCICTGPHTTGGRKESSPQMAH